MKKRIIGILVLLVLAMIPMALAEDENTLGPQDKIEVNVMNTPYGAQVRLLQLEKSITKNVLTGAKTIDVIKTNHTEYDTNTLETLLDQMEMILEEVKVMPVEGDKNTLAQDFVAIKRESLEISAKFRMESQKILTAQDRQQIQEAIKNMDKEQLQSINQEIKAAVATYNAEKIAEIFAILGINNPELLQKIEDANATKQMVKEAIKKALNDMNADARKEALAQLKENSLKKIISEKDFTQKVGKGLPAKALERRSDRMERLSNWLEKMGEKANEKGFEKRAQRLEKASNHMEKLSEKLNKWADWKEKHKKGNNN